MIQKILDLHIHSQYSRACSPDLVLPKIAAACGTKGIDIAATGDFTHPKWFEHIRENLVEINEGVYQLKNNLGEVKKQETRNRKQEIIDERQTARFVLGTELAVIKKDKGQTRRVHHCVFAPNLAVAEKFNKKLEHGGYNLKADGRPILGLTSKQLLALCLETDERMVVVPAHAWTPWFGIFGSKGGYDSLAEAFEDLTPHVFAIETGLSSDPLMNWRLSSLDNICLISNSDAHSSAKLGREANVLQFKNEDEVNYQNIFEVIRNSRVRDHAVNKFLYTIEFYPEEGKYHFDGHRDCQFVCAPEESKKYKNICPKCYKPLVIGVMNRVAELADRSEEEAHKIAKENNFIPYKSLVPLPEILADVFACGVNTKRVSEVYNGLIKNLGNEFHILLNSSLAEIAGVSSRQVAEAIDRVRAGKITVKPGYDGEFGVVKVFGEGEDRGGVRQLGLEIE